MMDDSEAQMETDVSSTTIDITEVQEITRSGGDVEMIVIVEKIKDEEELSSIEKSINYEGSTSFEFQPMESSEEITEMEKPSSQTEESALQTEKPSSQTEEPSSQTDPPTSQTLISDSTQKDKQTAEVTDLEVASESMIVTPTHPEQSLTPTPRISPIKTVSSSIEVELLAVVADSSSKTTHNKEDNTNDSTENIVQSAQYQSQSDHQYAAKNPSETIEPTVQPVVDTMVDISMSTDLPTTSGNEEDMKTLESSVPMDSQQKETSNDSQTEIIPETTEKEHNKSISRELKSLIKSAKESKIISECTQLTSKTRKSRTTVDSASTALNSLVEADKIQGIRRSSNNSQKSSCSEKSDKTIIKRSMRSQNPEFVNKVKQFLNSVTGKGQKTDSDTVLSDEEMDESKSKENDATVTPKQRKNINDEANEVEDNTNKLRADLYCWRCHWAVEQAANEKTHHPMLCTVCPRTFHFKCLSGAERAKIDVDKSWVCPECISILHAETSETRSPAMKKVSLGMLCDLLKYALERMMDLNGVEPFMQPVDRTAFPDYDKYVVHPMDLILMKKNINEGLYGSTEAFLADAQWILHNSIIFNTLQSKLTGGARALVRSCRTEMGEIEACPECYAAAHARRPTWFTDVCSTPHILLWAKLKGFPHWPAKGMSVNNSGLVDVRFFGAHDRAWVPAKDCYLYSEKDPNNFRTKRQDILDSMQEADQHIRNISRKYGKFVYPPFKTQFDPSKLSEQLKLMIPSFEGEVRMPCKEKSGATPQTPKEKSRLNLKNTKSSLQDGDTSEGDDIVVTPTRKMADGAEIAKEEEDYSINEKNKNMPVNIEKQVCETTRKRRRSELEEAVITILDCSSTVTPEKRKRCDDANSVGEEKKNTAEQEGNAVIQEISDESAEKFATTLKKSNELSNSTNEKNDVVESTSKVLSKVKPAKTGTPKEKESIKVDIINEGFLTPKQGPSKIEKSNTSDKEEKVKTPKRWNTKNKYLNFQFKKSVKNGEKTNDKSVEVTNVKDKFANNKNNEVDKMITKKNVPIKTAADNQKSIKERKKFDDDTSLAVIAQVAKNNVSCLPTISSVRSLSVQPSNECSPPKISDSVEITIEETSVSSIFIPTSTENVRNMKEAVSKLKKLRNETDTPPLGRVGVRAFARMTSPDIVSKEKELMQVEIKTEPVDLDEVDRHNEKMDLMNAFKLRPVSTTINNNLHELRINKVVVSPINARKNAHKQSEIRIKAKKTFPQSKKAEEGRSELNGKNSMVYIPIQPPMTQAPVRGVRPVAINSSNPRVPVPALTTIACSINTVTAPLIPHTSTSVMPNVSLASTNTCNVLSTVPPAGQMCTTGQVPTVRQASVQSLPFLTSLNGQWTFSLQPVMSVGGVDDSPTPIVNGAVERRSTSSVLPIANQSTQIKSLPTLSPLNSNATPSPVVTPSPNCTITNMNDTPIELPRLQQRPPLLNPLDANTPMICVPPPSTAGPLTARLNQNAVKLTDFFRTLLEESLEKVDEPIAQLTTAKLQLEQAKWLHQQEIDEIKHNHELVIAEMRASFEKEKVRAVNEVWRSAHAELDVAVKQTKSKQWCANCCQEAQFYCCWNTSYCDYPCQRAHWSKHFSICTQKRQDNESADGAPPLDNARHSKDNLPKSTQAPTLGVGNQLNPVRRISQEPSAGTKPSIIVSMVEDSSGKQSMKCVGTFKPQQLQAPPPLNINKQIMNKEESAKKVVTSGGYLIVGGGSTNNASLPTQRRPPTIQYFT